MLTDVSFMTEYPMYIKYITNFSVTGDSIMRILRSSRFCANNMPLTPLVTPTISPKLIFCNKIVDEVKH